MMTEMEKAIKETPVEEMSYALLRRFRQAYTRKKRIEVTAAEFQITIEKAKAIIDRFENRFSSEEEKIETVKRMYMNGYSNHEIKNYCCIVGDSELYKLYHKIGLLPRKIIKNK